MDSMYSLAKTGQIKDVDGIALEVALDLLRYPWTLGDHPKDGNPVILKIGRVGYMVNIAKQWLLFPRMLFETLPEDVALEKALELLLGKNADRPSQPKSKPKVKEAVEARESGVGK